MLEIKLNDQNLKNILLKHHIITDKQAKIAYELTGLNPYTDKENECSNLCLSGSVILDEWNIIHFAIKPLNTQVLNIYGSLNCTAKSHIIIYQKGIKDEHLIINDYIYVVFGRKAVDIEY